MSTCLLENLTMYDLVTTPPPTTATTEPLPLPLPAYEIQNTAFEYDLTLSQPLALAAASTEAANHVTCETTCTCMYTY